MISTLKSGCALVKSSAAILAAVTEPSPALSEYGPAASLSTPILRDRDVSANAGKLADSARSEIPNRRDKLIIWHPYYCCSEVQHERRRFRTRAADHHGLARGLLLLAEEEIAMIGNSVDDPGLAGAAYTFRAGV